MRDVSAIDEYSALIDGPRAGNGVHQSAFSGAVAADDGDEVAVFHGQIHTVESMFFIHRSGVEGFVDLFHFKHGSPLLSLRLW